MGQPCCCDKKFDMDQLAGPIWYEHVRPVFGHSFSPKEVADIIGDMTTIPEDEYGPLFNELVHVVPLPILDVATGPIAWTTGDGRLTPEVYVRHYSELVRNIRNRLDQLRGSYQRIRAEYPSTPEFADSYKLAARQLTRALGRFSEQFNLAKLSNVEKYGHAENVTGHAGMPTLAGFGRFVKAVAVPLLTGVWTAVPYMASKLWESYSSMGSMSLAVKQACREHGSDTIQSITVVRAPISTVIKGALLQLPGVDRNALKDVVLYHVFQVITLVNAQTKKQTIIRFDKDERVLTKPFQAGGEFQSMPVPMLTGSSITLQRYFARAEEIYGADLWQYDPISANCQLFVLWTLKANGLLTRDLEKFILQGDLSRFFTAGARMGMKVITNIASILRGYVDAHAASRKKKVSSRRRAKKSTRVRSK